MMIKNNRREWQKWVNPKLHKMYDELRKELMLVPEFRELEQEYVQKGEYVFD